MVAHDSQEASDCLTSALKAGFISGLKASVFSGGLYYLGWNYSPAFRYSFNTSARTALVVMPIFYAGWLNVEQTMHQCMEKHAPEYVVKED